MRGLSPVVASGGHSSSRCAGLSLSRPLLLRSTGSRRAGSVVVAHGPTCSTACGIFPDQGSNPCSLHRQADSQPLRHQGSPLRPFLTTSIKKVSHVSYHSTPFLSCPFSLSMHSSTNMVAFIYLFWSHHTACRIFSSLTRDQTRASFSGSLVS